MIISKDPVKGDLMDALRCLPLPLELQLKICRYSQDAWMQEVASLMGALYEMFVKMRFLTADQVEYPPHSGSKALDMDFITELGLSSDVIGLLQQLPYVADTEGFRHRDENSVFFHSGGAFLDYRNHSELVQSRDPYYAQPDESKDWGEDDGPYMRPWYAPLNASGNHGAMMIISVRSRQLIYIDQEKGKTIDPSAENPFDAESAPDRSDNWNALEDEKSRPVTDFLRDLLQSYEKLELLPGCILEGTYEFHHKKRIYLEHGWPDNFNARDFDAAMEAFERQEISDRGAERPLEDIESLRRHLSGVFNQNYSQEIKNRMSEELNQANEAAKDIPSDVIKRREERLRSYEAHHPFFH